MRLRATWILVFQRHLKLDDDTYLLCQEYIFLYIHFSLTVHIFAKFIYWYLLDSIQKNDIYLYMFENIQNVVVLYNGYFSLSQQDSGGVKLGIEL